MKKIYIVLCILIVYSIAIANSRDAEEIKLGINYDLSAKKLFLNSEKKKNRTLKKEKALIYSSNDINKNKIILDNKKENYDEKIELLRLREVKKNDVKIYYKQKDHKIMKN